MKKKKKLDIDKSLRKLNLISNGTKEQYEAFKKSLERNGK